MITSTISSGYNYYHFLTTKPATLQDLSAIMLQYAGQQLLTFTMLDNTGGADET
jgi:hypothetical protein